MKINKLAKITKKADGGQSIVLPIIITKLIAETHGEQTHLNFVFDTETEELKIEFGGDNEK